MLSQMTGFPSFLRNGNTTFSLMHSHADGPLGCFHVSVTVNTSAMYTGVQTALQSPNFNFFGYIPRSRTLDQTVVLYFLSKLHTAL